MSENITPEVVEAKPVKAPKVATACACSEFSTLIDGVTIDTGCTALTVNKFGPGHDAKLKSLLIKAGVAGAEVTKTGLDGSFEGMSAVEAAELHGFGTQVDKSVTAKRDKIAEVAGRKAEREAKRALRTEEAEAKKAEREAAATARKAAADEVKAAKLAEREAKKAEREAKKAADAHEKEQAKALKEAEKAAAAKAAESAQDE